MILPVQEPFCKLKINLNFQTIKQQLRLRKQIHNYHILVPNHNKLQKPLRWPTNKVKEWSKLKLQAKGLKSTHRIINRTKLKIK